jgi:DNA polymerase III epsilon subunit-like protein
MPLIAIDTETGGTDPRRHALLSLSACRVDAPENAFSVFILPADGTTVDPEAARVNGYTPDLWKERGAVTLRESLAMFKRWLPYSGNDPLAHNAPFDKAFLEAAEERAGFKTYLRYRWRCSMAAFMFANDVLGFNPPDFKLATLARMAGHWAPDYVRGDHQSIDDVRACAAGYRWLTEKLSAARAPIPPAPANEPPAAGELFVESAESRLARDIASLAELVHGRHHANPWAFATWRDCDEAACRLALGSIKGAGKPPVSLGK